MPAATPTVMSPQEGLEDPRSEMGIESGGIVGDFEDLWNELGEDLETRLMATEPEERYGGDELTRAFQLAFAFPEEIEVEIQPFGRGMDLSEHIQSHFHDLFNRVEDYGTLGRGAAVDAGTLLKISELIYIDDNMYRFWTSREFTTQQEDLGNFAFISVPRDVNGPFIYKWHQDLEMIWDILTGELNEVIRIDEKLESLYKEREEFIDHCQEHNLYMPITTTTNSDIETLERNIKRKLRRGDNVNTENVHQYCSLKEQQVR